MKRHVNRSTQRDLRHLELALAEDSFDEPERVGLDTLIHDGGRLAYCLRDHLLHDDGVELDLRASVH